MHPHITREQLLTALRQFDQELRGTDAWTAWERNIAHKWTIVFEGRRYPVKQIVALAANVAVHSFSGGEALNRRIARLGLTIERLAGREPLAPAPDESVLPSAVQEHIAELELRILTEQTRARLALAALAATLDLAQHAQECPIEPCYCGYIQAEALAAEAIAFVTGELPAPEALSRTLTRLTTQIIDISMLEQPPELPFDLFDPQYSGSTFVAVRGTKIVGVLQCDGITIDAIETRQYGVGRLLIEHLQSRCERLVVPNALADGAPFWEKLGFECRGASDREGSLVFEWLRP